MHAKSVAEHGDPPGSTDSSYTSCIFQVLRIILGFSWLQHRVPREEEIVGNKNGVISWDLECQDRYLGLCLEGHGEPLKVYGQNCVPVE